MRAYLIGIFSFLLASVFVYQNTLYPLHWWLQWQAQQHRLVSVAERAETYCLKIPMALPYAQNWEAPVQTSGLMEHQGSFYNYYQKDWRNDTLYVYYVKNHNARELFSNLAAFVKQQQDTPEDTKAGQIPAFHWEKKDYQLTIFQFCVEPCQMSLRASLPISYLQKSLLNLAQAIEPPPPRQT